MVSALLRALLGADFSLAARIGRLLYGFAPFSGAARDALIRSTSLAMGNIFYLAHLLNIFENFLHTKLKTFIFHAPHWCELFFLKTGNHNLEYRMDIHSK
jgi:hypothetical protein